MAKKVQALIKLQIEVGKANPSPPIGPALGQQGVNIMEFCKAFNAQTQPLMQEMPGARVTVKITVYSDRSFTFFVKKPTMTYLIKSAAKIQSGSATPNTTKVAKLSRKQLEDIAKIKMSDLTAKDMEAAIRTIAGTARNMGIDVEGVIYE